VAEPGGREQRSRPSRIASADQFSVGSAMKENTDVNEESHREHKQRRNIQAPWRHLGDTSEKRYLN
jgi:hypothetical protein